MKQLLGIIGEKEAVQYLKKLHYKIIATNFKCRFGEIDIIAKQKENIVFIEVKSRSNPNFGTPAEAISKSKLGKMQATASIYLTSRNLSSSPFRFDAIEVTKKRSGELNINHLVNITL